MKRYHAVVFHPGSRTLWRTTRKFVRTDPYRIPVLKSEYEPDPAEVIVERDFGNQFFAAIWVSFWLRCLKNVCAEVHVTTDIVG